MIAVVILQLVLARMSCREQVIKYKKCYLFMSIAFFSFQVEKLTQESIQHPTPLLKLLFTWTKNSRYFPLLSRKAVGNPNVSIMSCIFLCLRVPSVSADVVAMVMEMTDNLLSGYREESDLMECGSMLT